jgi:hypothetical protein
VVQHCPRCGAKNTAAEPLCRGCGQKLYGLFPAGSARVACGLCTAANPATAEYCVRCGRAIGEAPSPIEPVPSAPSAPSAPPAPPAAGSSPPRPPPEGRRSASPNPPAAPRLGGPRPAAPPPPPAAARVRVYSAGCLGGIAATVIAVLAVALVVDRAPQHVSPPTWRAESAVLVAERPAETITAAPGVVVSASAPSDDFAPPPSTSAAGDAAADDAGAAAEATGPATGTAASGTGAASRSAGPAAAPRASAPPGASAGAGRSNATPTAGGPVAPPGGQSVDAPTFSEVSPADKVAFSGGGPAPIRTAVAGGWVGEPVQRGALLFVVRSLDAGPAATGRWRLDLSASVQNLGGAPIAYDAALARVESAAAAHLPSAAAGGPLPNGVLAAGEAITLGLSFDLPLDDPPLTLRYDGVAVELGDSTLRTFRPPRLAQ